MATGTGLGGFLDCFFGSLFPPSLLRGLLINSVGLWNEDRKSLSSDLYVGVDVWVLGDTGPGNS